MICLINISHYHLFFSFPSVFLFPLITSSVSPQLSPLLFCSGWHWAQGLLASGASDSFDRATDFTLCVVSPLCMPVTF